MAGAKIRPVILCGGGGTRLWPLSTPRRPKQFLTLVSDCSMLAQTARRVSDAERFSRPLAIGAARHADLLRAQVPDADILLEPVGRNSAPPIAAACLLADADDLLLILPADHHIGDLEAFQSVIETGAEAAARGRIVTFGVKPDQPATGYGYIQEAEGGEPGPTRPVSRFVEKPDRKTAEAYLKAGGFYWNAGIFLFRAGTMLEAFRAHAPDILEGVRQALGDDGLDRALFSQVRSESIDYAVLEKAAALIDVAPVSMGWSDLGDFRALHEVGAAGAPKDPVLIGPASATHSQKVFVQSTGPRVAVHGLEDVAVVATPGAVLVTRLSDAAGVKEAAGAVKNAGYADCGAEFRAWAGDWLWNTVLPRWAEMCCDPRDKGFIEGLDLDGEPQATAFRRGRIAPRQLFAFSRAKRLGWNPNGLADQVIENGLTFLNGPARSPRGGWAHEFDGRGEITDQRRDLYDHAFVALAGSELAALGDPRGDALAEEAFDVTDRLFLDEANGGWCDCETGDGEKLANPHMHLLEAALAHFEALHSAGSAKRIAAICALFEQYMFDAQTGAVIEDFSQDWRRAAGHIEPGHCYEWAFLLSETERLTGRDTASWSRRLVSFAEEHGLIAGLAMDHLGAAVPAFRLWPQLERLRALAALPWPEADLAASADRIRRLYLDCNAPHCWIDQLDEARRPAVEWIPASMVYHLITGLAPFAAPPAS